MRDSKIIFQNLLFIGPCLSKMILFPSVNSDNIFPNAFYNHFCRKTGQSRKKRSWILQRKKVHIRNNTYVYMQNWIQYWLGAVIIQMI